MSLWKPLASLFSSSTFVNHELIEFRHIDQEVGNGVVAKKDFILKGLKSKDLIVESVLICAASKQHRTGNFPYCSLCCAFLWKNEDKSEQDSSSSSFFAASVSKFANETGFAKLPVWFQQCDQSSSKNFFSQRRCVSCSKNRVLCPDLPQSLEELLEFCEKDSNKDAFFSLLIQKFNEIAQEIDEALFSVLRAILMLLDEVVYGMKQRSDDDDLEDDANSSEIREKFSEKLDQFCSFFDEGVVPSNSCNSQSALVFRTACDLTNQIVNGIAEKFLPDSSSRHRENNQHFIELQQFFLLRCILQNNQHKSIVANPLSLMAKIAVSKQNENKEINSNFLKELFGLSVEQKDDQNESLQEQIEVKFPHLVASALFLHTARLNHSCFPNAHVEPSLTRSGASVRISVLDCNENEEKEEEEEIFLKRGEQVTISYLGYDETKLFDKKEDAHEYLKKNYGFECRD